MNFKPPFYLVSSEATFFVTKQREEESLSGSLSEDMKGPSQEALKAFPPFVYTRILWPIDIVLVDCHECYGRKILEWSMYIKIQYLDSIGILPKKKKKWKRKNKCRRERKWALCFHSPIFLTVVQTDLVEYISWPYHPILKCEQQSFRQLPGKNVSEL